MPERTAGTLGVLLFSAVGAVPQDAVGTGNAPTEYPQSATPTNSTVAILGPARGSDAPGRPAGGGGGRRDRSAGVPPVASMERHVSYSCTPLAGTVLACGVGRRRLRNPHARLSADYPETRKYGLMIDLY